MAVDFARHAQAFTRHFGADEPATYTRLAGGTPFQVAYVQAVLMVAFPEGTANAMEAVWCERSQFAATPVEGDTFAIPGKTYKVVGVRSDRAGGLYLALN